MTPCQPGRASTRSISARQRTDLLATRIGLPAARRDQRGGVGVERVQVDDRERRDRGRRWPRSYGRAQSQRGDVMLDTAHRIELGAVNTKERYASARRPAICADTYRTGSVVSSEARACAQVGRL